MATLTTPTHSEKRRKIVPVLAAGLLFLISAYSVEVVLRLMTVIPTPITQDYPLGLEIAGSNFKIVQKEFSISYNMNLFGFRDDDFLKLNNDKNPRVLFLGDSFTEGQGVERETRYSDILCRNMSKEYAPVDCVNGAQMATNPYQYYSNLINFGLALHPSVVVFGVFLGNDFMGGRSHLVPPTDKIIEALPSEHKGAWSIRGVAGLRYTRIVSKTLMLKSSFFRNYFSEDQTVKVYLRPLGRTLWELYFHSSLDAAAMSRLAGLNEEEYAGFASKINAEILRDTYNGLLNPSYLLDALATLKNPPASLGDAYYSNADVANTIEYFDRSVSLLRARKIAYLFLILPDIYDVRPDEYESFLKTKLGFQSLPGRLKEIEAIRKSLVGHFNQNLIPFIDLTDSLRAENRNPFFLYDGHLNPLGHQAVAGAVQSKLTELLRERDQAK